MVAPDLINVEVLSVLRRMVLHALIPAERGEEAVRDLVAAPIRLLPTLPLAEGIWRLRDNVSAYDACYIALAGILGCALVTADARLARAPGLGVSVLLP